MYYSQSSSMTNNLYVWIKQKRESIIGQNKSGTQTLLNLLVGMKSLQLKP